MKGSRVGPQHYQRMPWKNGLGVTTEIARFPAAGDSFDWRVSIADVVVDGPFSRFDGFDRIIVAIEGEGMLLDHPANGISIELSSLEPYTFPGEWETFCQLRDGAIRDFNVITRRETVQANLSIVRLDGTRSESCLANLVYCLEGSISIAAGEASEILAAGETFIVELREAMVMSADRKAAAIAVTIIVRGED